LFNLFIKLGSRKASSGGVRYQFWSNAVKKTVKQGGGHSRTGMIRSPEDMASWERPRVGLGFR